MLVTTSKVQTVVASQGAVALSGDIGGLLRSLREARGLTQSGLAKRLGIAPAQVSQIEAGSYTPSLQVLETILSELEAHLNIELNEGGLVTDPSGSDGSPAQETR